MAQLISQLSMHSKIFVLGVVDSISVHKTIPILVNDRPTFLLTLQVLAANGVLLLGSILIFNRGISPIMNFLMENVAAIEGEPVPTTFFDQLVWFIYQTFWLIPICALCYGCSAAWYQELADTTYKYLKGLPKKSSISKTVGFVLYGTLVWLFMFIQCQLLCNLSPVVMKQLIHLVTIIFATNQSDNFLTVFVLQLVRQILLALLHSVAFLLNLGGLVLMCLLYGWYGFDPQWISSNIHPDTRFSVMETHWAYFLGFGFPYVLIIKNSSFFVGYGVFLALFPFCIMLGSLSSYAEPYKGYEKESVVPIRLFKIAKQWTVSALKYIDKSSNQKGTSKSGKSSSGSSDSKNENKTANKIEGDKQVKTKDTGNKTEVKGKNKVKEEVSSELPKKTKSKDQ